MDQSSAPRYAPITAWAVDPGRTASPTVSRPSGRPAGDCGPRITWTRPPRRPREPRGWWNCFGSSCRPAARPVSNRPWRNFSGRFPGDADAIRDLFCPPTVTISRPVESSERIGKYEVIRPLGRGGQAETYLGFDPDLKRQVVLKLFHAAQAPDEQDLVLREGQALAGAEPLPRPVP